MLSAQSCTSPQRDDPSDWSVSQVDSHKFCSSRFHSSVSMTLKSTNQVSMKIKMLTTDEQEICEDCIKAIFQCYNTRHSCPWDI